MYYIYKIINKLNGNIYIGRTKNIKRRITEHKSQYKRTDRTNNSPLYIAMRRDGIKNFSYEVIETVETQEEADKKEIFYINFYRKTLGYGNVYNYQKGGVGGQSHDMFGENNPMYHKEVPIQRRIRVSQKLRGKKKPEGFGEKVSKALKGKKKSPEHVAKRSHSITVINVNTKEIRTFCSKAEMERQLHCCTATIVGGGTTKGGWQLYK